MVILHLFWIGSMKWKTFLVLHLARNWAKSTESDSQLVRDTDADVCKWDRARQAEQFGRLDYYNAVILALVHLNRSIESCTLVKAGDSGANQLVWLHSRGSDVFFLLGLRSRGHGRDSPDPSQLVSSIGVFLTLSSSPLTRKTYSGRRQ